MDGGSAQQNGPRCQRYESVRGRGRVVGPGPLPTVSFRAIGTVATLVHAVGASKETAGFWTHLLIHLTVNTFIIVIWVVSSGGFFWPVFPIIFWGIGLIANAWDAFEPDLVSENRIQREIERLRH